MKRKNNLIVISLLLFLTSCKKKDHITFYSKDSEIIITDFKLYKSESGNVFIEVDKNEFANQKLIFDSIELLKESKKNKITQRISGSIVNGGDFEVVLNPSTNEILYNNCENKLAFMISGKFNYTKHYDSKELENLPNCYIK